MSGRTRQSTIVLFLVLAATALLWGCGGSGQVNTTSTSKLVTTTASASSANGTSVLIGTTLKTTAETPSDYVDAIHEHHAMVLLFYVPGGVDDDKVLDSVTKLQAQFPDYVFLLYDYKSAEAYGDLSTLLKVNYPPQLVLIDVMGTIRTVWSGYVDEGTLNQSLVDLAQE
jgi:hypothetical protein